MQLELAEILCVVWTVWTALRSLAESASEPWKAATSWMLMEPPDPWFPGRPHAGVPGDAGCLAAMSLMMPPPQVA